MPETKTPEQIEEERQERESLEKEKERLETEIETVRHDMQLLETWRQQASVLREEVIRELGDSDPLVQDFLRLAEKVEEARRKLEEMSDSTQTSGTETVPESVRTYGSRIALESARERLVDTFIKWQKKSGWLGKTFGGEEGAKKELDEAWLEYSQARDVLWQESERNAGRLLELLSADKDVLQSTIKGKYKQDAGTLLKASRFLRRALPGGKAFYVIGDAPKIYRTAEDARVDILGQAELPEDQEQRRDAIKAMKGIKDLSVFSKGPLKKLKKAEEMLLSYRAWAEKKHVDLAHENDYRDLLAEKERLITEVITKQLIGLKQVMRDCEAKALSSGVDLNNDENYQRLSEMESVLQEKMVERLRDGAGVGGQEEITPGEAEGLQRFLETIEKEDVRLLNESLGDVKTGRRRNLLSLSLGLAVLCLLKQDSSLGTSYLAHDDNEQTVKTEKAPEKKRRPYKVTYVSASAEKDNRPVYYYPVEDDAEDDELVVRTDSQPKKVEVKKVEKKKSIKPEKKDVVITPDIEPLKEGESARSDEEQPEVVVVSFADAEKLIAEKDWPRADRDRAKIFTRFLEMQEKLLGGGAVELRKTIQQDVIGNAMQANTKAARDWTEKTIGDLEQRQQFAFDILVSGLNRGDSWSDIQSDLRAVNMLAFREASATGAILEPSSSGHFDEYTSVVKRELKKEYLHSPDRLQAIEELVN